MLQKNDEHPNYTKEKQGEFFSEFEAPSIKKRSYFFRQEIALGKKIMLNLSYENLILFFIVFIMLLVIFFSLGVEKGRRIALKTEQTIIDRGVQKVIEKKAPAEEKKVETITSKIDKTKEVESTKTNKTTEEKITEVSLKPYTIQVIAFKKAEYAEKEMERLKNEGYDVFMIPSNEWIQVCVGKYANKEESKKDFDILKKKYPTCYIRKIEKER